ncbi:MAG TPA: arylamine N-acetyltransferase [Candidatus Dormibacteraeota bacterium]
MIDVAAYTRRIGHEGPLEPTAATLRALQLAHLRAVPFENLDIHLGRPIVLDMDALLRKVVGERRGGFCYELNGTFAELLRALGFSVSMLAAEVANGEGGYGPPFDHMTLEVTCPGDPTPWLADVGFGDSFLEPLRLVAGEEQGQDGWVYRIDEDGGLRVLARRQEPDGPDRPQYRFRRQPHRLADYEEMCRYQQTSPDSHFTQGRICSLATPDGRITLGQDRLVVTRRGERTERPVVDDDEYRALLRDRFGIDVTGPWVDPSRPSG